MSVGGFFLYQLGEVERVPLWPIQLLFDGFSLFLQGGGVLLLHQADFGPPISKKNPDFGVPKTRFFFRGPCGAGLFFLRKSVFLGRKNPIFFRGAFGAAVFFATLWRHPAKANTDANDVKP